MPINRRSLSVYSRTSAINLAVVHRFLQSQGYKVRTKSDLIDMALSVLRSTIEKQSPALTLSDYEAMLYVAENIDIDTRRVDIELGRLSLSDVESEPETDLMEEFRKAQQLLARGEQ